MNILPSPCAVGWMVPANLNEVVRIENQRFEFPWRREDFAALSRCSVRMVAKVGPAAAVAGYVVYNSPAQGNVVELLSIAVAAEHEGRGIGGTLLAHVIGRMIHKRRRAVVCCVRERNVRAQCWLRKNGFVWTKLASVTGGDVNRAGSVGV